MKFFLFFLVFIHSLAAKEAWLREATSSEAQEIQNSLMIFYSEQLVKVGLFEDEKTARDAALVEWAEDQKDEDHHFFYYCINSEDNKMRYGYLIYSTKNEMAYLSSIYLDEKYQGCGFGKQILQDFETILVEKGIFSVKLYVFDNNQKAFHLYKKMGYEIETTYKINDQSIGHHMKKELLKKNESSNYFNR